MAGGYRYLEDVAIADVAFEAWGESLEELFRAAWEATLAAMVAEVESVRPQTRRTFRLEDPAADLLLVRFLQELVFRKDAEQLLLRPGWIRIRSRPGGLTLDAEAWGERIDPERHRLLADVKAVTFHRLAVEHTASGWKGTVVLDV
ncbi:MAG: archease [Deferrisomatales bacterium]